jgi:arylsulfatase A
MNASPLRLLVGAWIFLLAIPAARSQEPAKPDDRLNVVFMLADDLGWGEVGCFGQEKIPTPNLDRLARAGMRLTQHYSGAPVCAPSRCVLMTGRHLGHCEIRGNRQAKVSFPEFNEGQHPISESVYTIAQLFQSSGYATGAFGKWGLGPVGSSGDPNRKGFDLFYGYNCQAVAHSYYPSHLWKNDQAVLINRKKIPGHAPGVSGDVDSAIYRGENYAPDLMMKEAISFIDQNATKPFFLYLPFVEPHVAMHPTKASVDRFPKEWDTVPFKGPSYLPHDRPRAAYAAMISDLDRRVGEVLESLEKHGLRKKTLIVFTSDNGTTHEINPKTHFHVGGVDAKFFNSTRELRGYKGSVYEGGIRVPTIVSLPGKIKPNTENGSASYFADWFPTLASAAGLKNDHEVDGEDLWPSLQANALFARKSPMIWVFPEYGGQVAFRSGDFKVLRRNLKTRKPLDWEVYNVAEDRSESNNLASQRQDLISKAIEAFTLQTDPNELFPVPFGTTSIP